MKPKKRIQEMTFAALLTAIAILIPSIMPIKLIIHRLRILWGVMFQYF